MNQEQQDEIEVLSSIFPDEFELISSSPYSFKIHLIPSDGKEKHGKLVHIS